MGDGSGVAHVVAANMGYGHERPAHSLRSLAVNGQVVCANDYPGIPAHDKTIWETSRVWYERLSRFSSVPILGRMAFGILDQLQRIPDFYPRRDLSQPILPLLEFYSLLRRQQWCRHLITQLAESPRPLVCSYFIPAFAAEEFQYPGDIYVVLCDADISRGWVALEPKRSRIKYFAPTGRVAERLKSYGVRDENIFFTGFPLPSEAIGGRESAVLHEDLARRLCVLDPRGVFASHAEGAMAATLGRPFCKGIKSGSTEAPHLVFAVGGAGAQRDIAVAAVKSLQTAILQGRVEMTLVAGTRPEIAEYFRAQCMDLGLGSALRKGALHILLAHNRQEYFSRFDALMRTADVLWTKPSELSFYTGLGIPIIMAPTVGSQEDGNRRWLMQTGGGMDQYDPRYVHEWLFDWIHGGALARMAWNGFAEAPTHGYYRIDDIVRGRSNTMHELPLVL